MKLAFRPFGLKLIHTWAISRSVATGGGTDLTSVVLVKLTDGSTTGLGEASCSKRYAQSVDSIQSFLRLVNPQKLSFDDIPASMDYLEKLAPNHYSAKCALNLALVDGAARKVGQPVYDLFGLGFREKKHLTSMSIGIDSPAMIRRKVAEAAPFPILKLKIGAPGEKENLAALRAVDSQKTVRVDANEGWRTKRKPCRIWNGWPRTRTLNSSSSRCPPPPRRATWPGSKAVPPAVVRRRILPERRRRRRLRRSFPRRQRQAHQSRRHHPRPRHAAGGATGGIENDDRVHD